MAYFHCRTVNKRPPPTHPPPEADESNPHHGSLINPNLHSNRQIFSTGPPKLAMSRTSLWPKDKVLNVVFKDTWVTRPTPETVYPGSGVVTEKLKTAAETHSKRWEAYYTIWFTFDPHGKRDIRVGFGPEDRNWAALGKNALTVPPDERTMNLEFNDQTLDETYSAPRCMSLAMCWAASTSTRARPPPSSGRNKRFLISTPSLLIFRTQRKCNSTYYPCSRIHPNCLSLPLTTHFLSC